MKRNVFSLVATECPYNETEIEDLCLRSGFHCLDIRVVHIHDMRNLRIKSGRVPTNYDPFDRMLISQAKTQGFCFISHDLNFENYDEPCILKI